MSPSLTRRLSVAAATAGLVTGGWNAVLPDERSVSLQRRGVQAVDYYSTVEARTREERRRRGQALGEAVRADRMRPAEHAPREAGAVARAVLRRVP